MNQDNSMTAPQREASACKSSSPKNTTKKGATTANILRKRQDEAMENLLRRVAHAEVLISAFDGKRNGNSWSRSRKFQGKQRLLRAIKAENLTLQTHINKETSSTMVSDLLSRIREKQRTLDDLKKESTILEQQDVVQKRILSQIQKANGPLYMKISEQGESIKIMRTEKMELSKKNVINTQMLLDFSTETTDIQASYNMRKMCGDIIKRRKNGEIIIVKDIVKETEHEDAQSGNEKSVKPSALEKLRRQKKQLEQLIAEKTEDTTESIFVI